MEKNLFSYYLFNNLLPHCLQLHCSQCKKQYVYTMYMSLFLFLTILLSFGCCDEELSPFAGQIKEILI